MEIPKGRVRGLVAEEAQAGPKDLLAILELTAFSRCFDRNHPGIRQFARMVGERAIDGIPDGQVIGVVKE